MTLLSVFALFVGFQSAPVADAADRPSDAVMIEALQAELPRSRILSQEFRETARGGGRVACGLVETAGVVEPFSIVAVWEDPARRPVVLLDGAPPPAPPAAAHWKIDVTTPKHLDYDGDGQTDRYDRNMDTMQRIGVKLWCPALQPPAGTTWATRGEPNPARANPTSNGGPPVIMQNR